ncbi:putative gamma-glutamylcyclotransferase CG2811 [Ruditapes philippinarum]|uniref:putative gamma-glutamylcyclotransferase CG2811 n=1 Tax=Ruditapes philippinarum TaxID=129788 RepID=UPI00295A67A5|nr:putative gamma-glutamylcyclotransferase CG2811 [Ruditapes philippinarum]
MFLIFVYGTLKTGEPNYNLMKDETSGVCRRLGTVYTKEKYPLVVASRYNVPFLLYTPGTGHNVQGELYEVDDAQLKRLDKLENHPNLYVRKDVILTKGNDDSNSEEDIHAQAYFLVNYRPSLLDLPMLDSYKDMIDGKVYVKHSSRDVHAPNFYYEVHTDYEKDI